MKIFLSMICITFIVSSCDTSSEQNSQNRILEDFLTKVEEENKKDGPTISSASWISSNFITFDSQKVIADYGTRYTLNSLCLLYTSPSPRDTLLSRMPSSA